MLMDKTRIDYDHEKGKSVRRSNNPALQREIDEYNTTEAVKLMREKQRKRMQNMSKDDIVEEIREKIIREKNGK